MSVRPLPQPTVETEAFWQGAREGRLLIQHCKDCRQHQFYPRPYCIKCLSENIAWTRCSGKGKIYTFTINHRAGNEFMQGKTPYVVAIIELEEGVRLMANIVEGDLAKVAIDAEVRVAFERASDKITLPQFKLV
jgi:uncharacterized protein